MANAVEEFKKIMESDLGEAGWYEKAAPDETVKLPITRVGFEALLSAACTLQGLPVTNPLRNVLVGFLHHIENGVCTTTIEACARALRKAMSNQCSFEIDQEIKKIAQAELDAEKEKARLAYEEMERAKKIAAAQEKRAAKAEKKNGKAGPIVKHNDTPNEKTVS